MAGLLIRCRGQGTWAAPALALLDRFSLGVLAPRARQHRVKSSSDGSVAAALTTLTVCVVIVIHCVVIIRRVFGLRQCRAHMSHLPEADKSLYSSTRACVCHMAVSLAGQSGDNNLVPSLLSPTLSRWPAHQNRRQDFDMTTKSGLQAAWRGRCFCPACPAMSRGCPANGPRAGA